MTLQDARGRWHTAQDDEISEPFLMTVVGGSNHWLFVSSTGALTAGRTNAESAIFAYETEDRLHRAAGQVGPVTALWVETPDGRVLWRPFDTRAHDGISRSVSKRTLGDGVRFEETHHASGLTFGYEWALSNRHGFVRRCRLALAADRPPTSVELVDGLRALLPYGVEMRTQQSASVLVDAYKSSEILAGGEVGVFSLTSRIVDRPEPAEALQCTVAYRHGLESATAFLDDAQFDRFCRDATRPTGERIRVGRSSSFLLHAELDLVPGTTEEWLVGADIGWDAAQVVALQHELGDDFLASVAASVEKNRRELIEFVARADGLQTTAIPVGDDRHATNVMFNCMRGGVIGTDKLSGADVRDFVANRNTRVAASYDEILDGLGDSFDRDALMAAARQTGDADFIRVCTEYLPLTFSRRHGDPSRPWNTFNIHIRRPDGTRRYYYEGNWRDVFQNWEALLLSFPAYLESAWTTFFNATTADGHNPYRITRDGFDWERPDPHDPWAHIGYWGDHQIIYSLKLLEVFEAFRPGELAERLDRADYVFADVPYRIGSYAEIVADPHDTIVFDRDHDRAITRRREQLGADGNLVHDDSEIVRATLAEKLLVSLLAKLANLVVDGGIWMNTQRPEWNDANNALVGNGLSMVTLAYLVRHVDFLRGIFAGGGGSRSLHEPVAVWLEATASALAGFDLAEVSETSRRALLDALGEAASTYRDRIYGDGLGRRVDVDSSVVDGLLAASHRVLEHSLRASRRDDGMFHAYNLLELSSGRAQVSYLPAMLEGQVAALSSGVLASSECVDLVDTLFESRLYRDDQNTFLLYPAKELPGFLERGVIPDEAVSSNALLAALVDDPTTSILERDAEGVVRFGGSFKNAKDLKGALDELGRARSSDYGELVERCSGEALDVWEAVFEHHAYTGRSGSMFGYEGIGSVYWHMVSKLNLAMQECFFRAHGKGEPVERLRRMAEQYYALRAGLGDAKTFSEYGAFPTDAYSHTPPGGGARQPGMTGQVKEDILTRRGELGLRVAEGALTFDPVLLRPDEFLTEKASWTGLSQDGREIAIELEPGQLGFTVCQVPVVYRRVEGDELTVDVVVAGETIRQEGAGLDSELSSAIFERRTDVERIVVSVGRDRLIL